MWTFKLDTPSGRQLVYPHLNTKTMNALVRQWMCCKRLGTIEIIWEGGDQWL